jgi:glycogen synthase
MKVLMFGWEFPPHNSGGLGVACQGLSRALSESGVEVVFVLPKKVSTSENFKFVFADNVFMTVRTVDALLTP